MWNKKIILSLSAIAVIGLGALGIQSMNTGGLRSSALPSPTMASLVQTQSDAQANVDRIQAEIARLKVEIASYPGRITQEQKTVTDLEKALTALKSTTDQAQKNYDQAVKYRDSYGPSVVQPKEKELADARAEEARLKQSSIDLPKEKTTLTASIASLKKELAKYPNTAKNKATRDRINTDIKTAESRLTVVNSLITSLPKDLKNIATKIASLNTSVANLKVQHDALRNAVTTAQQTLTVAQDAFATGQRRTTTAQAALKVLTDGLQKAQTALAAAEAALVQAQTTLAAAQAAVVAAEAGAQNTDTGGMTTTNTNNNTTTSTENTGGNNNNSENNTTQNTNNNNTSSEYDQHGYYDLDTSSFTCDNIDGIISDLRAEEDALHKASDALDKGGNDDIEYNPDEGGHGHYNENDEWVPATDLNNAIDAANKSSSRRAAAERWKKHNCTPSSYQTDEYSCDTIDTLLTNLDIDIKTYLQDNPVDYIMQHLDEHPDLQYLLDLYESANEFNDNHCN